MISVIIPLYNKEKIIERTLRSVLSQDYDDYEVVIVDDGSTDGSVTVVNTLLNQLNLRDKAHLVSQPNGGPSKARNTGVKSAKGEWFYFIDADDEMEPGALSHLAILTREHPETEMFLGEVYVNDGKTKKIAGHYHDGYVENMFKEHFYGRTWQCSGSTLYKTDFCRKHLYNESIRRYEDLECLFRKYREGRVYTTSYPLASINVEFAAASRGRKDINEDFLGHLDFKGKSFWERMCLYKLYLSERPYYPGQVDRLYPTLKWRYDLLLLTKLLNLFK